MPNEISAQDPSLPYLLRLAAQLANGARTWPEERRTRHVQFLIGLQRADGGFAGRDGDSDLYYTAFAVRGLWLLDGLTEAVVAGLSHFLSLSNPADLGAIDILNWLTIASAVQTAGGPDPTQTLVAGWEQHLSAKLESLRRPDGGYAKGPEGAASSTYNTFLCVLSQQFLGQEPPAPKRLIQFLYDRQRDDGGFVEIGPMKNSGTNPTAAACALMSILNSLDPETIEDVSAFLKEVRSDSGGFLANRRIPFADLLSTFTATLTSIDIGRPELIRSELMSQWITSQLEFPMGGFRAADWDDRADVEYTFYGLGTLALLSLPPLASLTSA